MNKRESHVGKFAKNSLFGVVAMHFMDMQENCYALQIQFVTWHASSKWKLHSRYLEYI